MSSEETTHTDEEAPVEVTADLPQVNEDAPVEPTPDLPLADEQPSQAEPEAVELVVARGRHFIRGAGATEESIAPGTVFAATQAERDTLGIHCRPATEAEVDAYNRDWRFVRVPVTVAAKFAAFDHDGDGFPGGSRKGARRRRGPKVDG